MFLDPVGGRSNLQFPGAGCNLLTEGTQTFTSCSAVFMTWYKFCHYQLIMLEKLIVASLVLTLSIFMELGGFYYSKADQVTQDNRVPAFINCFHKIHFNISLDSKLVSSTPSFPYIFYGRVKRHTASQLLYNTAQYSYSTYCQPVAVQHSTIQLQYVLSASCCTAHAVVFWK